MPAFEVTVTIENKPGLSDPEGDTILRDLVLKEGSGSRISGIRTAKMLRLAIESEDADSAVREVRGICDRLRLYNPLVSVVGTSAAPVHANDGRVGNSGSGNNNSNSVDNARQ